MTIHEQVFDLIPAYTIGALSQAEARQLEQHLVQCATCQAELRAYQTVVEALPLAVPQRTPPEAVKQRLMSQVRRPVSPPQAAPRGIGILAWLTRLTPAWSLVSLVLILALATSTIWLWQRLNSMQQRQKFYVVNLAGTEINSAASAVLVISTDGADGTLVVERLPILDEAQQYQLWLVRADTRTSGGVFSVSKSGYAHMGIYGVDASLLDFESFGVTIEPAGGSPQPTGEKVLGGELTQPVR